MSIEWDNIVCDIPELYMLTMSTNYPMKLFMTRQGYIGLGPATLQKMMLFAYYLGLVRRFF